MDTRGLSRVSSSELQRLLRAVHRGGFEFPLSRSALIASGFGHIEGQLGLLVGLDQIAVQRVIVAALAERGPRPQDSGSGSGR